MVVQLLNALSTRTTMEAVKIYALFKVFSNTVVIALLGARTVRVAVQLDDYYIKVALTTDDFGLNLLYAITLSHLYRDSN